MWSLWMKASGTSEGAHLAEGLHGWGWLVLPSFFIRNYTLVFTSREECSCELVVYTALVGFVVDKVALGQGFLWVILFSRTSIIIPPWLSHVYRLGNKQQARWWSRLRDIVSPSQHGREQERKTTKYEVCEKRVLLTKCLKLHFKIGCYILETPLALLKCN
jgi:hypothetical protein